MTWHLDIANSMQRVRQLLFVPSHAESSKSWNKRCIRAIGQRDGTLIFHFADHGEQALSHGLVESDDADWELYDSHFFFPCVICLQDTRKGKK
jgi:hypothetical protein